MNFIKKEAGYPAAACLLRLASEFLASVLPLASKNHIVCQ